MEAVIHVQDDSGYTIPYDTLTFPGGEVHVSMKMPKRDFRYSKITANLYSANDIMKLLLITDALKRHGVSQIDLVCPYFPYARQDRVANPGEPLSVKVMADLVNSQGYSSVEIWDAHSDVTTALLDNVKNIQPVTWIRKTPSNTVLVSPDAGAEKKATRTAGLLNRKILYASKHRDTQTGEITGTSTKGFIREGTALIVDDICDGGRTFIELSKALKSQAGMGETVRVELYVTHGIFSNGFDELRKNIDHIYTANIWPGRYQGNEDFVTIINRH